MNGSGSLVSMVLFALATSATPGQVNVISAMTGASYGPVRAIPYVLGATASFVAMLLLFGLGLGLMLEWVDRFSFVLIGVNSAYMLWLAYRIATDRGTLELTGGRRSCPGFRMGLVTQGLNPKAWIVSLSAVSIYVAPSNAYGTRLAEFAVTFFVICSISLFAWAVIGLRVARWSGDVSGFNKVMAGLLTVSVMMTMTAAVRAAWS